MSERRIRDLEAQLADLESQRHRLEAGLLNLEHDGALPALSEQERISQYQQAEVETKKLEARLRGELAAKKALLENERDRKIAALQIEHERSQARANSEAAAAIRASLAKDLSRAKEESRKAVLKIETEGAAEERRLADEVQEKIAAIRLEDAKAQERATARREHELRLLQGTQLAAAEVGTDAQRRVIEAIVKMKGDLAKLEDEHSKRTGELHSKIDLHRKELAKLEHELAEAKGQHAQAADKLNANIRGLELESRRISELSSRMITPVLLPSQSEGVSATSLAKIDREKARLASAQIQLEKEKRAKLAAVADAFEEQKAFYKSRAEAKLAELEPDGHSAPAGQDSKVAEQIQHAQAEYRKALAEAEAETEQKLAEIVKPVVTSTAVYAGSTLKAKQVSDHSHANGPAAKATKKPAPKSDNHSHANGRAKVAVIDQLNPGVIPEKKIPRARGQIVSGGKTSVVEPATSSAWDVFYEYSDRRSWHRFQDYLRAYGVTKFVPKEAGGAYYIHIGRFYSPGEASAIADEISQRTNTSHIQIKKQVIPR